MTKTRTNTIMEKGAILRIDLTSLEEGMRFDAPVFFEGANLFLAPGLPVRIRDIRKLKALGVTTVYTCGNLVHEKPPQERLTRHTLLSLLSLQQRETLCLKEYVALLERSRRLFLLFDRKGPVEKKEVDNIVHRIYHLTKDYPKEMVKLIHGIDASTREAAGNALHTTIISVVMGLQKRMLSHEVLSLAAAAFLHDVGMLEIPPLVRDKKEKLSDRERDLIETHPARSAALIRQLGFPLRTAQIVLAHHERWDGKGYPRGVTGDHIPELAHMIAVADAYAALINERPYRRHLLGHDALKTVLRGIGGQFNPETVKLLLQSIGVYPLGSLVLLSNQTIGRVVETREETALRPTVEIIVDRHGQRLSPPATINLGEDRELYIVKTVNPQDLAS
ncbi:MAG TPA: HD domain-containing protein [Spirochaetia bacterium]|nr:HD domain-containing protein [Spirochaetia bacterium]